MESESEIPQVTVHITSSIFNKTYSLALSLSFLYLTLLVSELKIQRFPLFVWFNYIHRQTVCVYILLLLLFYAMSTFDCQSSTMMFISGFSVMSFAVATSAQHQIRASERERGGGGTSENYQLFNSAILISNAKSSYFVATKEQKQPKNFSRWTKRLIWLSLFWLYRHTETTKIYCEKMSEFLCRCYYIMFLIQKAQL